MKYMYNHFGNLEEMLLINLKATNGWKKWRTHTKNLSIANLSLRKAQSRYKERRNLNRRKNRNDIKFLSTH